MCGKEKGVVVCKRVTGRDSSSGQHLFYMSWICIKYLISSTPPTPSYRYDIIWYYILWYEISRNTPRRWKLTNVVNLFELYNFISPPPLPTIDIIWYDTKYDIIGRVSSPQKCELNIHYSSRNHSVHFMHFPPTLHQYNIYVHLSHGIVWMGVSVFHGWVV